MANGVPANAISVDVEDYFQVAAFDGVVARSDWDGFELRVGENTRRILELFDRQGVRGTFFLLGWVAERDPGLVRDIAAAGHEVASHGWGHELVNRLSPEAFYADVTRTRELLQSLSGAPVHGYRAPSFSIGHGNQWAFDVLADAGYRYSSSVNPIRHDIGGFPGAPRFPFAVAGGRLLEIPVTTVRLMGQNLPCGGGGYFRILPYPVMRSMLRRVNGRDGRPCVFYFHPWEVDPAQPRVSGAPLKSRFRHYVNLDRTLPRLERLLSDFSWTRMDAIFGPFEPAAYSAPPTAGVAAGAGA